MKKVKLSVLNFNAMGLFNFDTLHGWLLSRHVGKRLQTTAEILKQLDTDIIMLQEIHTYSVLKLLRRKLSHHPYVAYKPFFYGPRGGLVIFSKFPLEEIQYINFKTRGTFFNRSFIAQIIRNGILMSKIDDMPLYLLNTYLTPNTDHDYSENNRFYRYTDAQLTQIAEIAQAIAKKKGELILAGDFNTEKGSPLYNKFLQASKVTDVFSKFDFPTQHQEFVPKKHTVRRIDFIFLRNGKAKATIDETEHVFTDRLPIHKGKKNYVSDHIALKTEISFSF